MRAKPTLSAWTLGAKVGSCRLRRLVSHSRTGGSIGKWLWPRAQLAMLVRMLASYIWPALPQGAGRDVQALVTFLDGVAGAFSFVQS